MTIARLVMSLRINKQRLGLGDTCPPLQVHSATSVAYSGSGFLLAGTSFLRGTRTEPHKIESQTLLLMFHTTIPSRHRRTRWDVFFYCSLVEIERRGRTCCVRFRCEKSRAILHL